MTTTLTGTTAIAGIGATEFSKDSGRSELSLAVEAVKSAIEDAGIQASDVSGMVTFRNDGNPEIDVARGAGIGELTHFSRVSYGGGAACATLLQAAMAVETGVADVVVCYRSLNGRSERRFGQGVQRRAPGVDAESVQYSWYTPFGLATPASWIALFARRYMHEFGATSEDFGRVSVTSRRHAATNPKAYFHDQPISLEEHQASRMIVDPLRLFDCCQENDGAVACVVTRTDRARDLAQTPAVIRGVAQGAGFQQHTMTSYSRDSITRLPELELVARQVFEMAGIGPEDLDAAVLYDHFTPFVLQQLEAFGFAPVGEAKEFVRDGHIGLDGSLPVNTHGGQLGEAYIHGANGINEGVRQIRGTAANQVDGAQHVLVTAGTAVPTSAVILGRE